jgi:hypothetical protein
MSNPIQEFFDNVREIVIGSIIVIFFVIILGTLAIMPGATPEVKEIAEQGQQTISWVWIFYLGLPSVGIILAIILWVKKNLFQPSGPNFFA